MTDAGSSRVKLPSGFPPYGRTRTRQRVFHCVAKDSSELKGFERAERARGRAPRRAFAPRPPVPARPGRDDAAAVGNSEERGAPGSPLSERPGDLARPPARGEES